MPTYQYACTACGHRLDAVQSFTDEALTTCPVCQGRLRKLFSTVGVVFKGSGFYRTDSRNNGAAGQPDTKPETESTKTDSTKSESTTGGTQSTSSTTKSASAPAAAGTG